jgi:hypothetical protein
MTLTLNLNPDVEQRLINEAGRRGIPPDQYALEVLDQHLPASDRREQFQAMLRSWMEEEDPEEQRETFEYLVDALDQDRPSQRKLFPPALKGISW